MNDLNCGCAACLDLEPPRLLGIGFAIPQSRVRMVVCSDCGCKRCPHADNHANACTGSTGREVPGGHTCSGCKASEAWWEAHAASRTGDAAT